MDYTANELADYSFQSLPDLGTGLRHPLEGFHHIHTQLPGVSIENFTPDALLRAAFFKITLLYLDTRDFLFSDVTSAHHSHVRAQVVDGQTFRGFVTGLHEKSHSGGVADPEVIRQTLGIKDNENPLPVAFCWGEDTVPDHIQYTMALIRGHADVNFCVGSTVMSLPAAEIFLEQVLATLSFIALHLDDPSTTPLQLLQPLMSAYGDDYKPELAELTPLWLMRDASSRPHAVAHEVYRTLAERPEVLTYSDLNIRSNHLTRWLIGQGLQKGLCRIRDAHFYVAHAAIFKSGGCYVSVDPELPEERKRFIA